MKIIEQVDVDGEGTLEMTVRLDVHIQVYDVGRYVHGQGGLVSKLPKSSNFYYIVTTLYICIGLTVHNQNFGENVLTSKGLPYNVVAVDQNNLYVQIIITGNSRHLVKVHAYYHKKRNIVASYVGATFELSD